MIELLEIIKTYKYTFFILLWLFQTFYNEKPNVCVEGAGGKKDTKVVLMTDLVQLTFEQRESLGS